MRNYFRIGCILASIGNLLHPSVSIAKELVETRVIKIMECSTSGDKVQAYKLETNKGLAIIQECLPLCGEVKTDIFEYFKCNDGEINDFFIDLDNKNGVISVTQRCMK